MGFFDIKKTQDAPLAKVEVPPRETRSVKARAKSMERYNFLVAVVNYARDNGVSEQTACSAVALLRQDDFRHIAGKMSYGSFRTWISKTGREPNGMPSARGVDALCDRYAKEYIRPGDPTFWHILNRSLYNDERMPISKAYQYVVPVCRASGIEQIPTIHQVNHYFLKHCKNGAFYTARNGETWAASRLASYVHGDWSSVGVGEIWCGDHHVLDCYVRVWDDEAQKWRAARPWLTAWMDIRSMYFVGFHVGVDSPNSSTIIKALAFAYCVNGGYGPKTLLVDNGKDFLRMGLGEELEVEGHKHSILNELGVGLKRALPYHGQSKPIERVFKEVADGFCRTLPTYLGNKPNMRPETAAYYEDHPEDAPDVEFVEQGLYNYIYGQYAAKNQNGKIIGGNGTVCPNGAWANRKQYGNVWDYESLRVAMQLPLTKTRNVGQGFCVRIDGDDYRAEDDGVNINHSLNAFYGKKVMIKVDIFSGDYYAWTVDGKLITKLRVTPTVNRNIGPGDDADARLLSQEMARARKQLKWARAVVAEETGLPVLVSASEAIALMTPGAKLRLTGERYSVKGSTHKYQAYEVIVPGETPRNQTPAELPPPAPEKIEEPTPEEVEDQAAEAERLARQAERAKKLADARAKRQLEFASQY